MSEVTAPRVASRDQAPPPKQRRPFQGWGAALAAGLAASGNALVRATSRMFGRARHRSSAAVADFRARPEHARWRAYALGSYGAIIAATFAAQLYSSNVLDAYVKVQRVDLPALTQIFVRNDSAHAWMNVRVTLNGIYTYEKGSVPAGDHIMLPVDRFALFENGKPQYAPKNIAPQTLSIDCDSGHFETDLAGR